MTNASVPISSFDSKIKESSTLGSGVKVSAFHKHKSYLFKKVGYKPDFNTENNQLRGYLAHQ